MRRALGFAVVMSALFPAAIFAQTAATPAPASGQAEGQDPGDGQGVGSQGDPDPGVHFVVLVDNPSVHVLQVTMQPGAVRRPHVHNDVTFHMLVPLTGMLELTADGIGTVSAVPGQAYYMVKGQPHGFTNKGGAPVQVIEIFVKPGPAPAPWDPNALPVAPVAPATTAAPGTTAAPATPTSPASPATR